MLNTNNNKFQIVRRGLINNAIDTFFVVSRLFIERMTYELDTREFSNYFIYYLNYA